MTPIERAFRPPEGMEYDPAYNDFARQKWARADMEDAQRETVRAQRDKAMARREQLAAERNTRQAEDAAIEAIQQNPDQIPNILKSFPELARSRNLGGVLNYAKAVTPSAGQRTLAPSLRNKLKPHERQYFDEHFNQNGDALSAYDAAQMRGEHENGLVEMMKAGVPLDVVDKYRERPLNPLEREAIIQQHSKKNVEDDNEFARKKALDYLFSQGTYDLTKPEEFTRMQAEVANIHKLFPSTKPGIPVAQPPAVATPAAEGGTVAPVAAPAVIPAKIVDPAAAYEAIPTKTEADYLRFAGDKNATPEFREKVLKDLKTFAAKDVPVAEKGGSIGAVKERDKRIADTVKLAEKTAARADEENDYREAWTQAKLDIDTALNKMAEDTGYSPEQLAGTIAAGGQRILFKVGDKKLSPQQWLESLIGGKFHESAKPFQRWSNTSVGGQAAGKLASENWGRIFDAYRQEKAKPVASAAPAVNVAPPEWKPGQSVEFPGVKGTFTRNK